MLREDTYKKFKYYLMIFFVGCFVGWIYEVVFYFITDHALSNPGFLYGPYLPVYGWGALAMVVFLKRYKKHPVLLFLLMVFLTGVLEYLTGALMMALWHERWWDYTGLFLNINGYVCLRSVLSFGIGGLFLMYLIEPNVLKLSNTSKYKWIDALCFLLLTVFIIDNIIAFLVRHPLL